MPWPPRNRNRFDRSVCIWHCAAHGKGCGGDYIANEELDKSAASRLIDSGEADAVALRKFFLANPDLPRRLAEDAPLNAWDAGTFYGPDETGYTDYPVLAVV